MNYYITNFANIKKLDKNCICISTCLSDPSFFHSPTNKWAKKEGYYVNDDGLFLGIREELLSPMKIDMSDGCQKDCPNRERVPNCPFLSKYSAYLETVDFDYLLSEFNRVAEDVRKITNYEGDADICLLVYEAVGNPCSERVPLQELFKSHGLELKNIETDYKKEGIIF